MQSRDTEIGNREILRRPLNLLCGTLILIGSPSCAPATIADSQPARARAAAPIPSSSDNQSGPATLHYSRLLSHDTPPTPAHEYARTGTRPEHVPQQANLPYP